MDLEINFIKRVSLDLYEKVQNLPSISFEDIGVGEFINRLYTDPDRVMELLSKLVKMLCRLIVVIVVIIIYLFLGMIGMPVFSGGTAGPGVLFGPTGGYMLGWLLMGGLLWLIDKREADKKKLQIPVMAAGLVISYLTGTLWYTCIYVKDLTPSGILTAISVCVLPFIIPDLVKMTLAYSISKRIKKFIVNV